MEYFRIVLRANIREPLMDGFNIYATTAAEAIEKAKEAYFIRLSLQRKEVLENDIEVIRVTDINGEIVDIDRGVLKV